MQSIETRLLIVEDDAGLRTSLSEVLTTDGYCCLAAQDRGEALELARCHRIGGSLLDLSLGSESGIEVLVALRGVHTAMPAVMMSGRFTDERRSDALSLGVSALLDKPLDLDLLRLAIAELMAAGN